MRELHFCIDNSGLFAVAKCGNMSPRFSADDPLGSNVSHCVCPFAHSCAMKTRLAFWCFVGQCCAGRCRRACVFDGCLLYSTFYFLQELLSDILSERDGGQGLLRGPGENQDCRNFDLYAALS